MGWFHSHTRLTSEERGRCGMSEEGQDTQSVEESKGKGEERRGKKKEREKEE